MSIPESTRGLIELARKIMEAHCTGSNVTVFYQGREYNVSEIIANLEEWEPPEMHLPEWE